MTLFATLVLLAPFSAPHGLERPVPPVAATAHADDLAGLRLDGSGALEVLRRKDRDDTRTNLALYGQRPTLLIRPTTVEWRESKAREYVKQLRALDKRAAKWSRAGIEVVYLDVPAWVQDGDERLDLDLTARAKVKHMTCVRAAPADFSETRDEPARRALLSPEYADEFLFRWVLMEELGVVATSGTDALARPVMKRIEDVEPDPLASNGKTRKALAALDAWRLGEVEQALTKLEGADAEALRARLEEAEAHYRAVFHAPEAERGYLVEAAAHLQRLAEVHYGKGAGAERVREELSALRGTPEYTRAEAHYAGFQEQLAIYEAMEQRLEEVYEASIRDATHYDEGKYNQAIREVYPEPLARMTEFVRTQTESPYRKAIAALVMYAREELQDAGR